MGQQVYGTDMLFIFNSTGNYGPVMKGVLIVSLYTVSQKK